MDMYIGSRVVKAKRMTRLEYNQLRKWDLPEDEDGSDEGFLIEHGQDIGKQVVTHVGWLPEDLFRAEFRSTCCGLPFSDALKLIMQGHPVSRAAWGPATKMTFIFLASAEAIKANLDQPEEVPLLAKWNGEGDTELGWIPKSEDIFTRDWVVF